MDAQFWTYTLVGITFSLYIGIAIWSRAKSTKEFYIAGGGIHPVINGMATAADWMSAASFISMAGIISFLRIWWFTVFNGLDRWICITGTLSSTLS